MKTNEPFNSCQAFQQFLNKNVRLRELYALLHQVQDLHFTHYDKIVLTAERRDFNLDSSKLNKTMRPHPKSKMRKGFSINIQGDVPSSLKGGNAQSSVMSNIEEENIKYGGPTVLTCYKPLTPQNRKQIYRDFQKIGAKIQEISEFEFPVTKYCKIRGGEFQVSANSIKLILKPPVAIQDFIKYDSKDRATLPNNTEIESPIRRFVKDVIQYLIEKGFFVAEDASESTVDYFLNKLHFNEVELNFYFSDVSLFNFLWEEYSMLNYFSTRDLIIKFGYRTHGEENQRKAANTHLKLNSYFSSCYLWANNSSKLFLYNVTAKSEKRGYNLPGDLYKIELCLHRLFFKNKGIKLDFDLIKNIEKHGIFKKIHNAILEPIQREFNVELADVKMRAFLNRKTTYRRLHTPCE